MTTKHLKKQKTSKRWYTVAVLYPAWMTDWWGKDLYMNWAYAANVDEAVAIVQKKAVEAQADVNDPKELNPTEFEPVLVFEGRRVAVANATNFG